MSTPPRLQNVSLTLNNGVALLKYNRPKAGNALNTALIKDVLAGLRWADSHPQVRVIVQSGEGRFYTAGLDLLDKSNQGPGTALGDQFIDTLRELHKTMILSDKVLVAAVNGPAPGWGTSSLALSDLVYSSPDAFFFTPFVQWGLCAEACSSLTFAKIMGHQKASALILGGERMTAQELESAGLITKILPKENFLQDVLSVAHRISQLPPETLKFNKNLMMRTSRTELLEANEVELRGLRERARASECKTAIQTFAVEQERKKQQKSRAKL